MANPIFVAIHGVCLACPCSPSAGQGRSRAVIIQEMATTTEKSLAELCQRSFLSLWRHPHIYRSSRPIPHEVCDLLVVFGDDVIVFSDKSTEFPPQAARRSVASLVPKDSPATRNQSKRQPLAVFTDPTE